MREFLRTNINGSYINMFTDGSMRRTYAGYLIAAFHAPQDRTVIMDGLDERFTVNDNDVKPMQTDYKDMPYPCMSFEGDGIRYSKRMVLHPMYDMVSIDYSVYSEIDAVFAITPHITCRRPDTAVSPADLVFDIGEHNDGRVRLMPAKGLYGDEKPVILLGCSGEGIATRFNDAPVYIREIHYTEDERTGFEGTGSGYVPCRYECVLHPGDEVSVRIVCGAYVVRTGMTDTDFEQHMTEFAGRTSDPVCVQSSETVHSAVREDDRWLTDMRERLTRMADRFIVMRESTGCKTVLAGYPWFLDWGRDTMIAFTGLTLVTGRFDDAREILQSFDRYIHNGMLPNVFPQSAGDTPQYNTLDASLWYFHAIDMFIRYTGDKAFVKDKLLKGMTDIVRLYSRTREEMLTADPEAHCYGIYMDSEGLIHGGEDRGDQLTWMDVRINGTAVTPRHGCPVEIQALWRNALSVYGELSEGYPGAVRVILPELDIWEKLYHNRHKNCLYDCISGEPGSRSFDDSVRPNQLYAAALSGAGLPDTLAAEVLASVTDKLLVSLGIRSLSPDDRGYIGSYEGDLISRDRAYHMGTSWGFLFGAYADTYIRVHGMNDTTKARLKELLIPYYRHMNDGCIDGIAEVFDGDSPQDGKGCYSQAWSVAEILRICAMLT